MVYKILKWIGIVLLALLVIGFLLPGKVHIERMATINSKPSTIFQSINDLHQWNKWSPWIQYEPDMNIEYQNGGIGKGSSYTWVGKKMGKGKMSITESSAQQIVTSLEFEGMGSANTTFSFSPDGSKTKVKWAFDSDDHDIPIYMKPIGRVMNLFMDGMLGKDFEKGLKNLDEYVQKISTKEEGYVEYIMEVQLPETHYFKTQMQSKFNEIGMNLGNMYSKLGKSILDKKLNVAGPPLGQFPGYTPGDSIANVIAILTTDKKCTDKCDKEVQCGTWPVRKAIKAKYLGPYENNSIAYQAIEQYMKEKNLTPLDFPYEEYESDPMEEKDPMKIITNVYWPVK